MATTSTVVTVKAALLAGLQNALPDVQVNYGNVEVVEQSNIVIGAVEGTWAIPTMKMGRKHRNETYTVNVIIVAFASDGSALEAETEAFMLLAVLEDLLADNPALAGVNAAVADNFTSQSNPVQGGGAECLLEAKVKVSNRLQ